MADKNISEKKKKQKNQTNKNAIQKIIAGFAKIGKNLKMFFVNLKTELKRVIWPDRKRLIQSTATVLAICIFAAVLLFIVDSALSAILNGINFYTPKSNIPAITETVADTSEGA